VKPHNGRRDLQVWSAIIFLFKSLHCQPLTLPPLKPGDSWFIEGCLLSEVLWPAPQAFNVSVRPAATQDRKGLYHKASKARRRLISPCLKAGALRRRSVSLSLASKPVVAQGQPGLAAPTHEITEIESSISSDPRKDLKRQLNDRLKKQLVCLTGDGCPAAPRLLCWLFRVAFPAGFSHQSLLTNKSENPDEGVDHASHTRNSAMQSRAN